MNATAIDPALLENGVTPAAAQALRPACTAASLEARFAVHEEMLRRDDDVAAYSVNGAGPLAGLHGSIYGDGAKAAALVGRDGSLVGSMRFLQVCGLAGGVLAFAGGFHGLCLGLVVGVGVLEVVCTDALRRIAAVDVPGGSPVARRAVSDASAHVVAGRRNLYVGRMPANAGATKAEVLVVPYGDISDLRAVGEGVSVIDRRGREVLSVPDRDVDETFVAALGLGVAEALRAA